jgi:cell division transport system permease protein
MSALFSALAALFVGDLQRDRVVPASGYTSTLTSLTAAAMAFLVVFALALSLASYRLAQDWSEALEQSATLRISAPVEQLDAQVARAIEILETTPGVASARALSSEEQSDLLTPWLGIDVPFDKLPLPRLIEIVQTPDGFDSQGLRLRLTGELPSAVLDDHVRWRRPLVQAANWLSVLGVVAIGLIGLTSGAMIIVATRAALAANAQVITVLRLIGATDAYIEAAFVRRFAFRTFIGAVVGTIIGAGVVALFPGEDEQVAILTGLRLSGVEWVWLVLIPPILSLIAFSATRYAANRVLKGLT